MTTTTRIEPYLFLEGRAEDAANYYRDRLGGEITSMIRFKDLGDGGDHGKIAAGLGEKLMHLSINIGSTRLMLSDGDCGGAPNFNGFGIALSVPNEAAAQHAFTALADGGTVKQPLTQTFFSTAFGVVTDRFGVPWMVSSDEAPTS